MPDLKFSIYNIKKDKDTQVLLGHAGFIKSAEDIYEAVASSAPEIKFGVAFVEASGPCLVRSEGNDKALVELAEKNALGIGAGHTFIILFRGAFPINITNAVKAVPEVSRIYCATANDVQVILSITKQGRAVLGVVDGEAAKGVESKEDKTTRRRFLRKIGYKLG
jgi:adenosine/AMP kinase